MSITKTNYLGLPNCLRLANETVELIVTTDVGPRILKYALIGGENILGEHPHAAIQTRLGEWKPRGGHRLWIAPENMPDSYAPDNSPIEFTIDEQSSSVILTQAVEAATNTQKIIGIKLSEKNSQIEITHKIVNQGAQEIELAAWALTIMRGGGVCIVPNEQFAPYSHETLLPIRNLAVWSYTDFTDPRWQFEKNEIRLKVDEKLENPQKIGVLNKQGWTAYEWQNLRFTKHFEFDETAIYPDLNSNVELYTAGSFVEVETLSPLVKLQPGETVTHVERWELSAI